MTNWDQLATWWMEAGVLDPVYREDVVPMLLDLVGDSRGTFLDIGCGEGHVMDTLAPRRVIGCDITTAFLRVAGRSAPVVRCRLPDLRWLKPGSIEVAYAVFVVEHVAELDELFAAVHSVVGPGGAFVLIANHPAYTPAGAGPVIDQTDGEVLWRWGPYLSESSAPEPVGPGEVTYHHRTMARLLSGAADQGWHLAALRESGLGSETIAREAGYTGQEHMPRLLGVRWLRE